MPERVNPSQSAVTIQPTPTGIEHLIGGFSGGSFPDIVSSLGLNAVLSYGYYPVYEDKLSKSFTKYKIQVIDDIPDIYMRTYKQDKNLDSLLAQYVCSS